MGHGADSVQVGIIDCVEIRAGAEHTDFDTVHPWLASTYWSPGVSRERVEKAARHSALVVNGFIGGLQVGYCRIVSDFTTFAWVCDVYVDESARGQGIARQLVGYAMAHPDLQGLRRWLLATKDAHGVYEGLGFSVVANPERWMAHYPGR